VKHSRDEPGKVVNGKSGTSGLGVVSDVNSACRYARWVGEPLSGRKLKRVSFLGMFHALDDWKVLCRVWRVRLGSNRSM